MLNFLCAAYGINFTMVYNAQKTDNFLFCSALVLRTSTNKPKQLRLRLFGEKHGDLFCRTRVKIPGSIFLSGLLQTGS